MSFRDIDGVYVADTARVTGEATIGVGSSLWYGAVIRADVARVWLGRNVNVQDNAVIHCDNGKPNVIGDSVSIGHGAIVHGLSVGAGSLIGMGATVLGGTAIGKRCLVAAGAVVPPGLEVPDDHVVMGVPGKVVRETREKEREYLGWLSEHYASLAAGYAATPNDPRFKVWGGETPSFG